MQISKDIVIFGGGIAGLWLLNRLRSAGYDAVLLEASALGAGQSVASQGMIHGGMKYALGGRLTGASEAIADMPQLWRDCLAGRGEVDLQGLPLLSDTYYLWPRNSLRSRFNAFLGSKAVRGKVDSVPEAELPPFFKGHISSPLYRLRDIVLDVPAVLQRLAANMAGHVFRLDWQQCRLESTADGGIAALHLPQGQILHAALFVCCSGAGNSFFLERLQPAAPTPAMQRRPLQMVVVKHTLPDPVYVHCVSEQLTATPELTITTHRCRDGSTAWYLGGELAEQGAGMPAAELLETTRRKLRELFPWCDFSQARYHSFHIDRAEARQPDGKRPDTASVLASANLLYCWPTKLTLAPVLAQQVLQHIQARGLQASGTAAADNTLQGLPVPEVATTPWDGF
jgi:glycerol-3-phosphate dehydrogenase